MKIKTITFAALAALTIVGSASASTAITYSYYTATSSADTSWVSPLGSTSVKAVNFGNGQTDFGGVTWLSGRTGLDEAYNNAGSISMYYSLGGVGWAVPNGNFYTGANSVLNDGAYSGQNNFRFDINGLTAGQEYLVQFVVADNRDTGSKFTLQGASANITGQNSTSTQYQYASGQFLVVTADFTADGTVYTWLPQAGTGTQVNAVQVLAVPEPSSVILGGLGDLGMLALLRRRRACAQ